MRELFEFFVSFFFILIEFFGSFFSRKKNYYSAQPNFLFQPERRCACARLPGAFLKKRIRDLEEEIAAPSVDGCWW
jgi:hypothetical protein